MVLMTVVGGSLFLAGGAHGDDYWGSQPAQPGSQKADKATSGQSDDFWGATAGGAKSSQPEKGAGQQAAADEFWSGATGTSLDTFMAEREVKRKEAVAKAEEARQIWLAEVARQEQIRKEEEERQAQIRQEEEERQAQIRRDEEERQAQIRQEEEEEQAQRRSDEEREARYRREQREAQEAEDRQSTSNAWADLGRHIQQQGEEMSSFMANIDRQTIAAINDSKRVQAAQAAERERARAEREEREADRRRDAERDREARADAQRTADNRRAQEGARLRQQEQARQEKQARQQEQAHLQAQARQKEQARKEQDRERAEAEKSKLAEQQAEKQARAHTGNPGEDAQGCVEAHVSGDQLTFSNKCGEKVFVIWCGALKYTKKRCGDGPSGGFYTQSDNLAVGAEKTTTIAGEFSYGACKGGIGFGSDEFSDSPNGSYKCLKR